MAPAEAPRRNPARRPKRCMIAEIGVAASIEPITISVMGRVAKQMFGASDWPARPPIVNSMGICAPRMACASASTATLRFA